MSKDPQLNPSPSAMKDSKEHKKDGKPSSSTNETETTDVVAASAAEAKAKAETEAKVETETKEEPSKDTNPTTPTPEILNTTPTHRNHIPSLEFHRQRYLYTCVYRYT